MVGPAVTPGRCVCTCWYWIFSVDDGVHGSWPHGSQGRTDGGGGRGAEEGGTRRDHGGFSCRDVPWGLHTHTWTPFPRRGGLGTLSSPCLTGRGRRSKSREKSAFRPPSSGGKRRGRVVCLQGPPPPGGSSRGCKGIVSAALPCHHMPVDDEGRRGETARLTSRRGRLLSPPLRRVQSVRTTSHHIPLCSLPRGSPAIASAQLLVPTPGRPTQGWKGIRMSVCPALVDIRAQAHRLLWRNAPHHRSQYWG